MGGLDIVTMTSKQDMECSMSIHGLGLGERNMNEKEILELHGEIARLQRDIERYDAGDPAYPWSVIRLDLAELYDHISLLLVPGELNADKDRESEIHNARNGF
jgi:hypothetical protein